MSLVGDCSEEQLPVPCRPARVYITGSVPDSDGDGKKDISDNCVATPNPGQAI